MMGWRQRSSLKWNELLLSGYWDAVLGIRLQVVSRKS